MKDIANQVLTVVRVALAWTGMLNKMYLKSYINVISNVIFLSKQARKYYLKTYKMSKTDKVARSWLKVCFLMDLEDRMVPMTMRLEMRPHSPRAQNMMPSHQYS